VNEPQLVSQESAALQDFIIRSSLLLISSLQQWRQEEPDAGIEQTLSRHFSDINESRWLEKVDSLPGMPLVYPISPLSGVCPSAALPEAEEMMRLFFAVVVADSPVLVVGLLNPWSKLAVSRHVASAFPGRTATYVCLSPHSYVQYAAMIARKWIAPQVSWEDESLEEWCGNLGFAPDTFLTTTELVENLWIRDPVFPVIPPHSFERGASILPGTFVFVVRKTDTVVWVATTKPTNEDLIDKLFQALPGRRIRALCVAPKEARRLIENSKIVSLDSSVMVEEKEPLVVRDWKIESGQEAELWNRILESAIRMGASDIYLDPKRDRVRVRFALDGVCVEQAPIPIEVYDQFLVRLKIKGNMVHTAIGEIQDGHGYHFVNNIRYDQRYSILILQGNYEKVVVRIFSSSVSSLSQLGLPERELNTLMWFLEQNNGMMICTGPTGSGKTTTLYACLSFLNTPARSIITLEQPVEKHFEDLNQVDIRPDAGITFASSLRAAMRQAPHIIMVGEIRDTETAGIAVSASLTGHLVLTTLHTEDAPGAIERMHTSFGIDKVTLANSLKLVIAQRLIPRLCPACKRTRAADPNDLRVFPSVPISNPVIGEPVGCPSCRGTGFIGRSVVMEMLAVDPIVMSMLEKNESTIRIREFNENRGFTTLGKQATKLMLNGEITIEWAKRFMSKPVEV
jgi:type II secretory ATPase GspE/PulE/Tfp pilus assembly ATPase PilB-like protein